MQVTRRILMQAQWRKSSYSNAAGGDCLEVADGVPGTVPVRDSKRPIGPVLLVPTAAWATFIEDIKRHSS